MNSINELSNCYSESVLLLHKAAVFLFLHISAFTGTFGLFFGQVSSDIQVNNGLSLPAYWKLFPGEDLLHMGCLQDGDFSFLPVALSLASNQHTQ